MEYILHVIIMLNIYVLLVLSANLPIGMANLYKESDIMKILDDAYKRCRDEQRWV